MKEYPDSVVLLILRTWVLLCLIMSTPTISSASLPATLSDTFATMRKALQQALHLQFVQAFESAAELEVENQPTLPSRLTRGMIAYLQARWQTDASVSTHTTGHETLQLAIEEGQKQLAKSTGAPEVRLFVGLAKVFDALLQQENDTWLSLQLFAQGQLLLRDVLVTDSSLTDAHLGLGLFYFAGADLPMWLRRIWGNLQGQRNPADMIRHLERVAQDGHFGQDIARTFLARIYELEGRYKDAISISRELQERFPENGYYTLLSGRSQWAYNRYAACVSTLGGLVVRLENGEALLERRHDRFDLYYYWGRALQETERYTEAYGALRQAVNEDPRAQRDETLWAKYYLAWIYERRGQTKTAHQMYRTLLRGRDVDDLHRQVQKRLEQLQSSR